VKGCHASNSTVTPALPGARMRMLGKLRQDWRWLRRDHCWWWCSCCVVGGGWWVVGVPGQVGASHPKVLPSCTPTPDYPGNLGRQEAR